MSGVYRILRSLYNEGIEVHCILRVGDVFQKRSLLMSEDCLSLKGSLLKNINEIKFPLGSLLCS